VIDAAGAVVGVLHAGPADDQPQVVALAIATAELEPLLDQVQTTTVDVGACTN
jgi:hypothetical protein